MKLVDNWRQAHKWASVRLAVLAGVLVTYATSVDGIKQLAGLISYVPEHLRPIASVLLGLVTTTIATASRLTAKGTRDA